MALEFLRKCGYKILERNFRQRFGEVDIIALDGDTLVFVEVKARWSERFGQPLEAITPSKIRSLARIAHYYKLLHPKLPDKLRIDAVGVSGDQIQLVKGITS